MNECCDDQQRWSVLLLQVISLYSARMQTLVKHLAVDPLRNKLRNLDCCSTTYSVHKQETAVMLSGKMCTVVKFKLFLGLAEGSGTSRMT